GGEPRGVLAVEARDEREARPTLHREDLVTGVAEVGVEDARAVARQGRPEPPGGPARVRVAAAEPRPPPEPARGAAPGRGGRDPGTAHRVGRGPMARVAAERRAGAPAGRPQVVEEALGGLDPDAAEVGAPRGPRRVPAGSARLLLAAHRLAYRRGGGFG